MRKIILLILFILFVFTNNVLGTFEFAYDISPGVYNSSIVLGDINNDGYLDLIMTGLMDSTEVMKVYKNDGNGIFIFTTDIDPGVMFGSIALGDIDNDGYLDLVHSPT